MKLKLSAILLSFYLLFSQLGYGYVLHFCHDELSHVKTIFDNQRSTCCDTEDSCCSLKSNTSHEACCDDVIVRSDVDDNLLPDFKFGCQDFHIIEQFSFDFGLFENSISKPIYFLNNHPAHGPPLYVLFSQFIIYG